MLSYIRRKHLILNAQLSISMLHLKIVFGLPQAIYPLASIHSFYFYCEIKVCICNFCKIKDKGYGVNEYTATTKCLAVVLDLN